MENSVKFCCEYNEMSVWLKNQKPNKLVIFRLAQLQRTKHFHTFSLLLMELFSLSSRLDGIEMKNAFSSLLRSLSIRKKERDIEKGREKTVLFGCTLYSVRKVIHTYDRFNYGCDKSCQCLGKIMY